MIDDFRADSVLAHLKDFQRASVEHAFEQLYGPSDSSRFLVADEVGLGKTMVARGIIAKAIEHLAVDPDLRIDIIYICSNQAIAQQNIRRLNVIPEQGFSFSSRMTMIAQQVAQLDANRVNFVSFTPGTSFDLKSSAGMGPERVLIYWLLRRVWGDDMMNSAGARRLLKCAVAEANWDGRLENGRLADAQIDDKLIEEYSVDLTAIGARERYLELARAFEVADSEDPVVNAHRNALIGELRTRLATRCVERLEPDLVILDEFQRFRSLMRGDNEAGLLAKALFDFPGNKTLMLSATPYKMYTSQTDEEDHHHRDFFDTIHFLLGDEHRPFDVAMDRFRNSLLDVHNTSAAELGEARKAVEAELKKVMVRTERLGAGDDRNGMLVEHADATVLEAADVGSYVALERAAAAASAGTTLEYWKSIPLFMNFMDSYKVDERIEEALVDPGVSADVRALLRRVTGRIDWQAWTSFDPIDSGNARFRSLAQQTADRRTWRMLWLAPSLPYYELGGPWEGEIASFTKRLIFSTWSGVPKAVSSLLSYEVERQMFALREHPIKNDSADRAAIRGLLQFRHTPSGEAASMTSFAMVYPSPVLAELGDPLALVREDGVVRSLGDMRLVVGQRITDALEHLHVVTMNESERVDQRWYWAAPLLLDRAASRGAWMSHKTSYVGKWVGGSEDAGDDSNFRDHIELASKMHRGEIALGRQPDDLVEVLTDLALGAPGVVALRSLAHLFGTESTEWARIQAAARMSWGFRSLFNLPDVNSLVRSVNWEQEYWRTVTQYCAEGCLTAVLDEFLHVLRESLGYYRLSREEGGARDLLAIADAVAGAVNIRTTSLAAKDHLAESDATIHRFRTRYAMRFGSEQAETEKSVVTAEHLRSSFNSPFWPFVLTSTSVGQEGLDFHLYCHAIVHWNLPNNPVDLEQREGRVHRYKGHAIRRNVARQHAEAAWTSIGDPWSAMFDEAVSELADGENELMPYWIYPGEAKIERHVPMLPLSREVAKLARLKRDVARYRLVLGQPRQDDLIEYLGDLPAEKLAELRIDLSPAPVGPLDYVPDEEWLQPIIGGDPEEEPVLFPVKDDRWTLHEFLAAITDETERAEVEEIVRRARETSSDSTWFGSKPNGMLSIHPYGLHEGPFSFTLAGGRVMVRGHWTQWKRTEHHEAFAPIAAVFGQDHWGPSSSRGIADIDLNALWSAGLAYTHQQLDALRGHESQTASEAGENRRASRKQFWTELLPLLKQDDPTTWSKVRPRVSRDLSTTAVSGLNIHWCLATRRDDVTALLWIDAGDAELNSKILENLREQLSEAPLTMELIWQAKEGSRSCSVESAPIEQCGWETPTDARAPQFPAAVQMFRDFKTLLEPHLPAAADFR